MILTCMCLFFCSMLSLRTLIHASENVAFSIGGKINDYCYLSDNNNENRYILYEFVDEGYLIYDTINDVIAEYSLNNHSPFCDMNGEYYYFGPTLYMNKFDNEYKDSQNNTICLENYNDVAIKYQFSDRASKTRSSSEYRVPYSYYFEKLDGVINSFPENVNGDCGYVAASILLSYYDLFYNSDIIADEYITPVSNDSFLEEEWTYFPCANMLFKNLLHTFYDENATTSYSMHYIINSYFLTKDDVEGISFYNATLPNFTQICNQLSLNRPLILYGNFDFEGRVNHGFIVYGFNEISYTEKMLLAHLGWEDDSEVWFNLFLFDDWNISGTALALNSNSLLHKHGDTFKINNHSYCISEGLHIDEYVEVYSYGSPTHHNVSCECGRNLRYEEHDFIIYLSKTSTPFVAPPINNYICSKCGYVKSTM